MSTSRSPKAGRRIRRRCRPTARGPRTASCRRRSRSSRRARPSRGAPSTAAPTATATSATCSPPSAAGDRYEDHALPFLLSEPLPEFDAQGEFWPDGRPNRFNRPQALTLSGCFKAGAIACTNCHVAHGSANDFSLKVNVHDGRAGDQLCTQCHQSPPATPIAGVHAAADARRPRISSRPADGPDSRIPWTAEQTHRSLVPRRRFRRQPLRELPHERRELAAADPPPRSHLPAAGARDHRGVRRPQRLHHLPRRQDARVGGTADGRLVGRRRAAREEHAGGDDDVRRRRRRRRGLARRWRQWPSIARRARCCAPAPPSTSGRWRARGCSSRRRCRARRRPRGRRARPRRRRRARRWSRGCSGRCSARRRIPSRWCAPRRCGRWPRSSSATIASWPC